MPFSLNSLIKTIPVFYFIVFSASTAFSQNAAVGTLERDKITAGQQFHLKIRFDEAPTFASGIQQRFNFQAIKGIPTPPNPVQVICNGRTQAGKIEADLTCEVPDDADGGIYSATQSPFTMGPRPGGSKWRNLKIIIPDFEVLPVADTNIYPQNAVAAISLNQRQILESGAATIEALLDQLNTRIDNNAAETPSLKAYLTIVAREGQKQLDKSRSEYDHELSKGASEPIFFEDFARQYAAIIIEIRAPRDAYVQMDNSDSPHLQAVQLSTKEAVTVRPTLAGSLGPLASKLAELLGDHMAAFVQIAKTGSTTFTISLKSSPPGASVSYKRIGEEYQDYSALTDIPQATFPYARWTFRFRLDNCEVVKTPNPFIEKSPNLNAQMQNCQKK